MEGHGKGTGEQFVKERNTLSEEEVIKSTLKLQSDTGSAGGECFRLEDLGQGWSRRDIQVTKPLISRLAWPRDFFSLDLSVGSGRKQTPSKEEFGT